MAQATREPTKNMADALQRVVDAGQSLFLRRVEIAFVETLHALEGERGLFVAVPFAVLGWLFFLSGARAGLAMYLPLFAVDLGIGVVHLVVAGGLLHARGRSR